MVLYIIKNYFLVQTVQGNKLYKLYNTTTNLPTPVMYFVSFQNNTHLNKTLTWLDSQETKDMIRKKKSKHRKHCTEIENEL